MLGALLSEFMGYSSLMGVQPKVQPMFATSTYSATLSAAYICKIYLENHLPTLYLWVSHLVNSQC